MQPSAIAEDPTGRFVYVTDEAANQLIGYVVQAGGALLAMVNGPFATGQYPVAVTVDPRGEYVYVSNYNARSISAYALNTSSGAPSAVAGTTIMTDPNPVSITIDPALGVYLYTANNLASTVTGAQLNSNTGALVSIQNTPFPASGTPTSVAIAANGSHPTEAAPTLVPSSNQQRKAPLRRGLFCLRRSTRTVNLMGNTLRQASSLG